MTQNNITLKFLGNCARCGGNHKDIEFKAMANALEQYTHWAPCPNNGDPILLEILAAEDTNQPELNLPLE